MRLGRATALLLPGVLLAAAGAYGQNEPGVLRFAVIGDSGTGNAAQREIARRMAAVWRETPFEFVLMLGDNLYGSEEAADYARKFEQPYAELLASGVRFYAVLGNHDEPLQRHYPLFHMNGRRYYVFEPRPDVRFIALDSTRMDALQLRWLEDELARRPAPWTLVFMHHPLYSSGRRHGPSLVLRELLEPLFVRGGVRAVFAGHEHFYERHDPQNGIHYFISGAAGQLRRGNIRRAEPTGCGFDRDNSFLVAEITAERLRFRAIARDGAVVDEGVIAAAAPAGHSFACRAGP